MNLSVFDTPEDLGRHAAQRAAGILSEAVREQGRARLVLSTGASQFETLSHLARAEVDWSRVEMFHLDEYMHLPAAHPASFRRYLNERFIRLVSPGSVHLIDTEEDIPALLARLSREIREHPVDLAIIGIGENAHIAFNDPPADFDTQEAYIVVGLDEDCKRQQVGEGWFPAVAAVPEHAVTMSVSQILLSRRILSPVPHPVKARAVRAALHSPVGPNVPASALRRHPRWELFLDRGSASLIQPPAAK